jgi:hypothetical protein
MSTKEKNFKSSLTEFETLPEISARYELFINQRETIMDHTSNLN